jgi:hypothetical protein
MDSIVYSRDFRDSGAVDSVSLGASSFPVSTWARYTQGLVGNGFKYYLYRISENRIGFVYLGTLDAAAIDNQNLENKNTEIFVRAEYVLE